MANEHGSLVEQDQLAEVLFACLQAVEAGESPQAVRARYPEFAAEVAEFLADRERFEHLAAPFREAVAPSPLRPGEAIKASEPLGDFDIIREVGRGGMGVVYEAVQRSLGRRVALKVLPFASAMDPTQLRRFQTEALAAAQLHHTHIVPVYSVGCERGVHYYAMQFIEGQTLAAVIGELRQQNEVGQVARRGAESAEPHRLASLRSPRLCAQPGSDTAPVAHLSTERSTT